jgi:hypothetical protein
LHGKSSIYAYNGDVRPGAVTKQRQPKQEDT